MKPQQGFRKFVNQCLHSPSSRPAKFVNGSLVFLIIFSVSVIPLHFLPDVAWAADYLLLFDKITVTIFTIEYALRIWSAKRPFAYIFSWWGIIDLAAILPFYLSGIGILKNPEVFLLLRILRILKLGKIYEIERNALADCADSTHGDFHTIEGEKIERVVQKHPVLFLAKLSMPLAMTTIGLTIIIFFQANIWATAVAVLFFFFSAIFFFKAWLDFNYDVIYITNKRIVLQDRELFGSITNDISYESITNVKPNNIGIWHFILGFGSIHIETAARKGSLEFHEAPKPHEIVRHISENRQKAIEDKKANFSDPQEP